MKNKEMRAKKPVGSHPESTHYRQQLQQIDLNGEEIKDIEIIGSHENGQNWPVLFHATFDYCTIN